MQLSAEQWFIDLDGVRSGPYQTPEVLSLIAEGEILPHHRISMGLKDQKWITILDWRLNQAKISNPATSESDQNEMQHFEEVRTEIPSQIIHPPKFSEPESEPEIFQTQASIEVPEHTDITIETPFQSGGRQKVEPMSEMFDMLQKAKTKRELRSQQDAQQADAPIIAKAYTSPGVKFFKTLIITTAFGFLIGLGFQYFSTYRKSSAPPSGASLQVAPHTATAPKQPETTTEIIERNTDKVTIRSKITKPVVEKIAEKSANPINAPAPERDTQDIKDLKKELQELKSLKEELKRANAQSGSGMNEQDLKMPEGQVNDPNYYPNENDSRYNEAETLTH